jgi:uncharacterized protein YeaO (DUF488 family)
VVRVVRLGSPRARGEGLRLGTARRPPRGVKKSDYARRNFYDVWLPELAPSAGLIKQADKSWSRFVRGYRSEMRAAPAERLLTLLARLSRGTNFSVGCYCEREDRCHRSILKTLLKEKKAEVVG